MFVTFRREGHLLRIPVYTIYKSKLSKTQKACGNWHRSFATNDPMSVGASLSARRPKASGSTPLSLSSKSFWLLWMSLCKDTSKLHNLPLFRQF